MDYSKTKTFRKIVSEIEKIRKQNGGGYNRWYIGVTNEIPRRYREHKRKLNEKPFYWYSWFAYSKNIALAIEKHFHDKGMLDGSMPGNVNDKSKFVYIYKERPDFIDRIIKSVLNKNI